MVVCPALHVFLSSKLTYRPLLSPMCFLTNLAFHHCPFLPTSCLHFSVLLTLESRVPKLSKWMHAVCLLILSYIQIFTQSLFWFPLFTGLCVSLGVQITEQIHSIWDYKETTLTLLDMNACRILSQQSRSLLIPKRHVIQSIMSCATVAGGQEDSEMPYVVGHNRQNKEFYIKLKGNFHWLWNVNFEL